MGSPLLPSQNPTPTPPQGEGGSFVIRPATDADLPRIAELMGQCMTDPFSVETLREWRERFPSDGFQVELVAEVEGEVRCFGSAQRWPHEPAGRVRIRIHTDRVHRNAGLGRAIFDALPLGEFTDVRTDVREDDPDSFAFAQRRGFAVKDHLFESALDLAAVDLAPLWGWVDRAEAKGVRFFSYGETAMTDEELWRLYDVNMATARDIPGNDSEPPSFDEWRDEVKGSTWFDPAGQFVAAIGNEWVGIGAVGQFTPRRFYNLMTGVRRAHLGCGIASALKLLGIRYAQSQGGETIRTNNHAENGAMLAINGRIGYVPDPGWYVLQRETN